MEAKTFQQFQQWVNLAITDTVRNGDIEYFYKFVWLAIENNEDWDIELLDNEIIKKGMPNAEHISSEYQILFERLKDFYNFTEKTKALKMYQ
jgi:hypothetical protein